MKIAKDAQTKEYQAILKEHTHDYDFCYNLQEGELTETGLDIRLLGHQYHDDSKAEVIFSINERIYLAKYSTNSYDEEYQYEGILSQWYDVTPVVKTITVYE